MSQTAHQKSRASRGAWRFCLEKLVTEIRRAPAGDPEPGLFA